MNTLDGRPSRAKDHRPGHRPILEAESLGRRFANRKAVDDVTFEVEEGEVFGFLGPNGAGKTTTINILCTLLRPTEGRARVAGHDVVEERTRVRRAIGLVFQQPTLDEALTAEQNLRFHAYAYGVPGPERSARIRRLLTMVELWERRHDEVRTFSGGMRRRLEIARGLLHRPRMLFLDEPTLGLDPQTRRRISEYLRELRSTDALTIFLTTHYMDEAENCDRIAIMDHGRIVALDSPAGLKRAVGGDLITVSTPDPLAAAEDLRARYGLDPVVEGQSVRVRVEGGEGFVPRLIKDFRQPLESIGLRRPTLDDVFLELTGHDLRDETPPAADGSRPSRWRRR